VTDFEDTMNREYRELARQIPVKVFFGEELDPDEYKSAFPFLFQYIDLSNQQVFLRQIGRVSDKTWPFWRDGIRTNLKRPGFKQAWDEIKAKAQPSFSELRTLEKLSFTADPKGKDFVKAMEVQGRVDDLEPPNETTLEAFAEDRATMPSFQTVDELRKDLLE
jgi:hypothetical protein